jgi:hypothetical protein
VVSSCTGDNPAVFTEGDNNNDGGPQSHVDANNSNPTDSGNGGSDTGTAVDCVDPIEDAGADADADAGDAGPPGRTIYVDTAGLDSNPGTKKCPLKTTTAALALALPTSTITTIQLGGVDGNTVIYKDQETFPLSPQKALTLKGQDGMKVTLQGSGQCGLAKCTVDVGVGGFRLANVTVQATDAAGDGVTATADAKSLALSGVTVNDCGGAGVHLIGTTLVTIDKSSLVTNGRGLVLENGATVTVTSSNLNQNTNEGALVTGGYLASHSSTFAQNLIGVSVNDGQWTSGTDRITNNKSHGAVSKRCNENDVFGVYSEGSFFDSNGGDGLEMLGCSELIAKSTDFSSNTKSGLLLGPSSVASLGDGQSGNDGKNTFGVGTVGTPNGGSGICNQILQKTPAFGLTACFDFWTSSPPSTGASCAAAVDIATESANPVTIHTNDGQCN